LIFQDEIIGYILQNNDVLLKLVNEFNGKMEGCLSFLEEMISIMKHFPLLEDEKSTFSHKLAELDFFEKIVKATIIVVNGEEKKPMLLIKVLSVTTFMLQYKISDLQDTLLVSSHTFLIQEYFSALLKAARYDEEGVQIQVINENKRAKR
jgi:hypothetical protein